MSNLSQADIDEVLGDIDLLDQLRVDVALAKSTLSKERRAASLQLTIAAQVHRSLLPAPIRHPQINVDVRYLPIEAVGGDYCQVRFPQPASCCVTMCDVAGHGIGPALLASRVSSEVRHYIMDGLRPAEIVRSLNKFIFDYFRETHLFLSFVAARIDLDARTIAFSGAGHPAVLHLRPGRGCMQALRSHNLVIGVKEDCLASEPERTYPLAVRDRLLFYTDGLTETMNARGQQLGQSRLSQFAAEALELDTSEMADRILAEVIRFRNGPPTDDMTLITLEVK